MAIRLLLIFFLAACDQDNDLRSTRPPIDVNSEPYQLAGDLSLCGSKGTNSTFEWIESVRLGDQEFRSGQDSGYRDHFDSPAEIRGRFLDVTLTPGFRSGAPREAWVIWVDFDQNGSFDASEMVLSEKSTQTIAGRIDLDRLPTGDTALRVAMKWNHFPRPCLDMSYGEVEDFLISKPKGVIEIKGARVRLGRRKALDIHYQINERPMQEGSKRYYWSVFSIPGVVDETVRYLGGQSGAKKASITLSSLVENGRRLYPDGNVPLHFELRKKDDDGTDLGQVAKGITTIKVKPFMNEPVYKIGVFQVMPTGVDLQQLHACLVYNRLSRGTGFAGRSTAKNCQEKYGSVSNTVRSISVPNILFNPNDHMVVDNFTTQIHEDLAGAIKVYSFKYAESYWQKMLVKHSIRATPFGVNPKFKFEMLGPFAADPVTSNRGWEVREYFTGLENKFNIDPMRYDAMIYIHYRPEYQYPEKSKFRSFAIDNAVYLSFELRNDLLIRNDGISVLIHELGHAIFGADDLYVGFGIKYPSGVYDPRKVAQKTGCMMASAIPFELYDENRARRVKTKKYIPEYADFGFERFHAEHIENYALCAKTIVSIMGHENPHCSLEEFYTEQCGDCTSLNYTTCRRQ